MIGALAWGGVYTQRAPTPFRIQIPGAPMPASFEYPVLPSQHTSRRPEAGAVSGMMNCPDLASLPSDRPAFTNQLRLAVAAYLGCFKDSSREHTASGLCCYLAWCAQR